MTEWELRSRYNYFKLADDERRAFDRWQARSGVTASLFAVALLAMALNAWFYPNPTTATTIASHHAATDGRATRDLVVRVGDLPTQEIDSPF